MERPVPVPNRAANEMAHPLTFFVSSTERRAILAALRAIDTDRVRALCNVLGIAQEKQSA